MKTITKIKMMKKLPIKLVMMFLFSIIVGSAIAQCSVSISSSNVLCNGGNSGSATAIPSGGQPPYAYAWSSGHTIQTITGLSAGSYSVTVTDNNGCTAQANISITEPSALTTSATSFFNVSCNGGSNGSATATAAGGTAPYTYIWLPMQQTAQTITGLSAGTYSVTVTDNNGCTASSSATISEPPALVSTTSHSDASCGSNNGSATAFVTGGTSPYIYSWSNGATTSAISGIAAGKYAVTVTDINGCSTSSFVYIGSSGGPTVSISVVNNVSCYGGNNGSATAIATGGNAPYYYSWSHGPSTQTVTDLSVGKYFVTVTDNNGCTGQAYVSITQPGVLASTISQNNASCGSNNGSATAAVAGGTPPYAYLWSNGATVLSISGLSAGTYTFVVTDANGCTSSSIAIINSTGGPDAYTYSTGNVTCYGGNNGFAKANATGGTSPYSFSWNTNPPVYSPFVQGLSAGSYIVTVTDASGCIDTAIAVITEPSAIAITMSTQMAGCGKSNGSASAMISGGMPGYSYFWSNGVTASTTINNLPAGNYWIDVTDNNGCTAKAYTSVTDSCGSYSNVWPGDCNNDLKADYLDFLNIAVAYNITGPVRPGASTAWYAQPAPNWSQSFNGGPNYKHADCDGDGTVDIDDAIVIIDNYGLTHPKTIYSSPYSAANPDIYLTANVDTAGLQQTVIFDINLGNSTFPLDSIYGIVFKLHFESNLIKDKPAITYGSSWLGNPGTDLISFEKSFHTSGFMDLGVAKSNQLNSSGGGKIGEAGIVTTDNLSGFTTLHAMISDVTAITYAGTTINLNASGDTVTIDPTFTSVRTENFEKMISVYPNPSKGWINIHSSLGNVEKVQLFSLLGENVLSISNPERLVDVSELTPGIYTVGIQINNQWTYKKVVLEK